MSSGSEDVTWGKLGALGAIMIVPLWVIGIPLNSTVSAMGVRVELLESRVVGIETKLDRMQMSQDEKFSTIHLSLAEIQTSVGILQTSVGTLQASVSALVARMESGPRPR